MTDKTDKSVLPMLLDDDTSIIVSRMAGGARQRQGFPADLHLMIKRSGKEPEERRYIQATEEENRAQDAAMAWSKVEAACGFANLEAKKAEASTKTMTQAAERAHQALAIAANAAVRAQDAASRAMEILGIPLPEDDKP
jgi:hypothetical protein